MATTTTTTTTTTGVQLMDYNTSSTTVQAETQDGKVTNRRRNAPTTPATYDIHDEKAVLQASLAADSAAPDGGYGWAIVVAGAMMMWWASGTTYAWGVIQRKLVEEDLAGPAVLSFIGSLQAAMVSVAAMFHAHLMRYIGARWVAIIGMTMMGLSEILASFTTHNVGGLFFTFGFLTGAGASAAFVVVTAIPAQYFNKKRGLANGLIFAGSGFGGAANSAIIDVLIRKVGLEWAYRILGILTLITGISAGYMMKERTEVPRRQFVEWRMFKNVNFTLLWLAAAIGNFPNFVPAFFLPLYSKSLGLSSSTGAGLVAGYTLASAVGRIFCGFWCDKIGAINVLFASLILNTVSMLAIWPASSSIGPLILFVIINGVSNGGYFSTMPTVATSVFGSARVGVVMSMIMTGWVGGYLMGAPIAGYLLQAFGGSDAGLQAYRPAMIYAGLMAAASAILLLIVRLRINKKFLARV